jgi:hypothetical protein
MMKIKIALLIAATGITFSLNAKSVSIEKLIIEGKIFAEIISKGGHIGCVIEMKVKNISGSQQEIKIEAGRRLDMPDSLNRQDILVSKEEEFILAAGGTKTIEIHGFCCQASKGSPGKGDKFTIGKMADSLLIKLARFIDKNNLWKSSNAQNAVWVLSDKKNIAGIAHLGDTCKANLLLLDFVCKLINYKLPEYQVHYKPATQNGSVFNDNALKITGRMEYFCKTNSAVSFGFYEVDGDLAMPFFTEKYHNPGNYAFNWEFNVDGLPKGKYQVRLRMDGQVVKVINIDI